jgi:hypothetical protein
MTIARCADTVSGPLLLYKSSDRAGSAKLPATGSAVRLHSLVERAGEESTRDLKIFQGLADLFRIKIPHGVAPPFPPFLREGGPWPRARHPFVLASALSIAIRSRPLLPSPQAVLVLIADWFNMHSRRLWFAQKLHPPANSAGRAGQPKIGNSKRKVGPAPSGSVLVGEGR